MNFSPSEDEKPNANSWVLDASALLALVFDEPGRDTVARAITEGAAISAVNLAEVVSRLIDEGLTAPEIDLTLAPLQLSVRAFDSGQAWQSGLLRASTRRAGLSLGDRACLALAGEVGMPALTADRSWSALGLAVEVVLIR